MLNRALEAAKKELEALKKQLPPENSPPQQQPQESAADEERVSQAQEARLALVLEVKQLLVDRTLFLDRRYVAERPGGKEQHEVGEGTKWYIRRYQGLHGLPQTGEVTVELRDHLKANCGTRFIKKRWQKWGCTPAERARNVAAQTKAARIAKAEARKRREHRLAQKREPTKPAPVQVAVHAAGQRTKVSVLPARTSLVNAVRLQGVTIDPAANHRSTVTIIPDESRLPICPAQTCAGSIPASVELAFSPSTGASSTPYRLRVQLACDGTSTDAATTTASNCHIDPTSVGDVVETLSTKIHGFAVEAGTRRR